MSFFAGFEKRASSLIGSADRVISGLRAYKKGGVIGTQDDVKPGNSIIPRHTPQQLATFAEHHPKHNNKPNLPWSPVP